jgi:hypothetical protein
MKRISASEKYLPVQNIKLDIIATGEWKEGVETETFQDYFDGFTDFNVQLNEDSLFHNDRKSVKELLIIAKAKMFGGHCYLGLSREDKMIYRYVRVSIFVTLSLILIKIVIFIKMINRPILKETPGECYWSTDKPMEVGIIYEFHSTFSEANTNYPHKNEDLLVSKEFKKKIGNLDKTMFHLLMPLAKVT